MHYLSWNEEKEALEFIKLASEIAKKATCTRSKCGSIIVKNWEIVWTWYNSPTLELESQRRCSCYKNEYHKKVTDKTCCIHAEQRAMFDALRNNPEKIVWARLYFIRLDENDEISLAGEPYCTICSKMSLDLWIKEFVLLHEKWVCVYESEEYNNLSYKYSE